LEMAARGIEPQCTSPDVFTYRYRGVRVDAMNFAADARYKDFVLRRIEEFEPDAMLVSDDKERVLLECAVRTGRGRSVLLLQTIVHLPFGPLSAQHSEEQAQLIRRAGAVVVISRFLEEYVRDYGGLTPYRIPMPVYGDGPFPDLGNFERGFVTMINPCAEKGLATFLGLAREFSDVEFAAVPTWGADESVLTVLRDTSNVRLLEPADDVEAILRQTRILLVPSCWPETFGYVVPEAMVRGIPVLASDVGGLPEAKLGVDYLLPPPSADQSPAELASWSDALRALLSDPEVYESCSSASRKAAMEFISGVTVAPFEDLLHGLCARADTVQ
jgi:glycosyltransferase involved in cell wall biosynthesis